MAALISSIRRRDGDLREALRERLPGMTVAGRCKPRPRPWNGAVTASPFAWIACRDVADVRRAVQAAVALGAPLSVAGGRHDPSGRAFEDSRVLLDVAPMSQARFNPAAGTVTVGGGATAADLLRALPDDVVAVTGTVGTIGMAGLTTGGGYGKLTARYGLAADALRCAELVLADGRAVRASATEHPDLFWALRGGGTGFGVITAMTVAAYSLPEVGHATFVMSLGDAKRALLACQETIDRFPDHFSAVMAFAGGPDGRPALNLSLLWTGRPRRGAAVLDAFALLPGAWVVEAGRSPYAQTLEPADMWPWGCRYDSGTVTLGPLDSSVAKALVEAAERMPTPRCILFLQDFHGAPTRVPPSATAFPLRRDHHIVGIVSGWDSGAERDAIAGRAWVKLVERSLGPLSMPGGYVNFLPPDEENRARLFYGEAAERLLEVKRRYDPSDVFDRSIGHLAT